MLEPVRPEAVLPDRALCLTTFSLFLVVNKSSLSLTHSLPLSGLSLSLSLSVPSLSPTHNSTLQHTLSHVHAVTRASMHTRQGRQWREESAGNHISIPAGMQTTSLPHQQDRD